MGLLLGGCAEKHPLVGNWKTTDENGKEAFLFFHADNTFEAVGNGEKLPGQWAWTPESDPPQLELTFEQKKIITIAKLEGDQLLIEPRENQEELPKQFSAKAQKYRRQP